MDVSLPSYALVKETKLHDREGVIDYFISRRWYRYGCSLASEWGLYDRVHCGEINLEHDISDIAYIYCNEFLPVFKNPKIKYTHILEGNVNDLDSFRTFISHVKVLFFDFEFKDKEISLVTLGSGGATYIVDMYDAGLDFKKEYTRMLSNAFSSTKILKIGYSIGADLGVLVRSFCRFNNIDTKFVANYKRCLDLCEVVQNYHGLDTMPSLQGVVAMLFNVRIDKEMQMFNWFVRPLTDDCIRYASHDVNWCVKIFNHYKEYAYPFRRTFEMKVN